MAASSQGVTNAQIVRAFLTVLALAWIVITIVVWLSNLSIAEKPDTLLGCFLWQAEFVVKALKHIF